MPYSITKPRVVSILAKKNFSNENLSRDSIPAMDTSQLRDLLNDEIGPKPKMTAREVSLKGGIAEGYLSELKSGAKDPLNMTLDAVLRLAKGLHQSEITIFLAAIGKLKIRRKAQGVEKIVDALQLDPAAKTELLLAINEIRRADLEYTLEQVRAASEERLDSDA
jgi:hypothetical protein